MKPCTHRDKYITRYGISPYYTCMLKKRAGKQCIMQEQCTEKCELIDKQEKVIVVKNR